MSTDNLLDKINEEAWLFEKITLDEMDSVKLMDRMDVKYLIPLNLLPEVLQEARPFYKLLEINNERLCSYETLYYDTEDYKLYHSHQSGRLNRYKVRFRNYVGSNLSFFEIKHKNNKGRTLKTRIKQPSTFEEVLNKEKADFLEKTTPLLANELKGNLMVNYKRMTLVNKTSKERLTMDLDLTFIKDQNEVIYNQLVVAEVKQEKLGASPIIDIFKKHNLRAGSISKYCLGVMSTDREMKHNRFKTKFLHLKKIINQYDSFAGAGI
ncbi:polyphosphate polymerase domain-containing protein [Lacihabitans soyangensis]|uniref:Polyphosphate polymerase domain-containing protein n=1 Tax=Lacihabitans soyangensis TaxID=869394 RepID=A0AAE3KS26_9BACT|nr:polyphosphate polymerase domain-containing protein [Lacihabitans soyangensis]MCP9762847.1 polyphosphate polymerase domain-containing protein [Lacihabitans soyangensis]